MSAERHNRNTPKLFFNLFKQGLLVLLLTAPLSGLVLDGFDVEWHLSRPVKIAALFVTILLFWQIIFRGLWLSLTTRFCFHLETLKNRKFGQGNTAAYIAKFRIPILLIALTMLPFYASEYWLTILVLCLIYILLALGLNIVVGFAGLLDLGFVGFYAIGAYTYALGYQYFGLGFWSALLCAGIFAACMGALLGFPVLKMHGDYLAIVTLGFGEIIRLILNNWSAVTGGPNGVSAPMPTLFGLEFARVPKQGGQLFHEFFHIDYSRGQRYLFLYFILLVLVSFFVILIKKLRDMPMGRAWEALREDEIACRALGINHVVVKLSAFSLGALVAGIAGVLFAALQGFVNPTSFSFFESALILAMVVLGGMGSIVGVICAAIILTLLPELLRDFSSYRVLIFGILMVAMMIIRPSGLIMLKRKFYQLIPGRSR